MVEMSLVGFLFDFLSFVAKALYEVPLEVSIGTAVLLTFIWLTNEIFGRVGLWRVVLVTVWGLVLIDAFVVPVSTLAKEQVWLVVLFIGVVVTGVERELAGKVRLKTRLLRKYAAKKACPHCGAEISEADLVPMASKGRH
jgi:hypothetical protein